MRLIEFWKGEPPVRNEIAFQHFTDKVRTHWISRQRDPVKTVQVLAGDAFNALRVRVKREDGGRC